MRDDTTTDDEDVPTTEHTHEHADGQTEHTTGHSSRLADAGRIQLSRPRELGRYLDEERYPAEVYPTLRSEQDLWLRAVEDLRIDDVFAENYTHDSRAGRRRRPRGVDGIPPHAGEAVLRAVERLTWTQEHGGAHASDCLDIRDDLQAVDGDIGDDDLTDRLTAIIGTLHEADSTHCDPEAAASDALARLAPLATWVARHRPVNWDGASPAGVDVTEDATLRIDAAELDALEVTVPTDIMMEAVNSDEPTEAVLDAALTDLVNIEYIASTSDSEADI